MIEYEFNRQTPAYAGHDRVEARFCESMLNMMLICFLFRVEMVMKNEGRVMMSHEQGDSAIGLVSFVELVFHSSMGVDCWVWPCFRQPRVDLC